MTVTPMNDCAIRDATLADAASVQAIYAAHVAHGTASFELESPDLDAMHARMRAITEGGYPWLVAEARGRVLGYAYAGPYRARPAYRHTVEDSIYLAPDALGRGLGRRLLDTLVATCTARGHRQMIALIGDSGNAASIGVHAAAGFVRVGVLRDVGRKFGRWIDVVLMQRALGEGAGTPPPGEGAATTPSGRSGELRPMKETPS